MSRLGRATLTLRLYTESAAYAESRGIIVADTKFEFGLLPAVPSVPPKNDSS
jgi:phosphoribosylaminoimidazole-succinocarboxamide synthase